MMRLGQGGKDVQDYDGEIGEEDAVGVEFLTGIGRWDGGAGGEEVYLGDEADEEAR